MALNLANTFVQITNGTTITVTDTTGTYNVNTNEGGYGTPNPSVGNFSNYYISCYLPDPITLSPSATPIIINAYPSLPSSSNGTFDLTSLLLTGVANTPLADGWYLFEIAADYDTGITEGTATNSVNLILFKIVDCCITNLTVKSINCGCDGASKKSQNLTRANIMLDMLRERVVSGEVIASVIDSCDQYNLGVSLLQNLQDICEDANCGGCNGCK